MHPLHARACLRPITATVTLSSRTVLCPVTRTPQHTKWARRDNSRYSYAMDRYVILWGSSRADCRHKEHPGTIFHLISAQIHTKHSLGQRLSNAEETTEIRQELADIQPNVLGA